MAVLPHLAISVDLGGGLGKLRPLGIELQTRSQTDLSDGPGACSMFRMFQGWLSMSWTGPNERTLLVNPMLRLATAYFLLRPFFNPIQPPTMDAFGNYSAGYLAPENWTLEPETTPLLQGATPSQSQELNNVLHPHLNLPKTTVHIPEIEPGDYVVCHCDCMATFSLIPISSAEITSPEMIEPILGLNEFFPAIHAVLHSSVSAH